MKQHRRSILALVAALTVLFNLERADLGGSNVINIETFVYVLAAGLVAVTLSVPRAARLSTLTILQLWLGAYLLCKLVLFEGPPVLGGLHTYLTISEIALLVVVATLSHRLSQNVSDFEQAVWTITVADLDSRVGSLDEPSGEVHRAILFSRRTEKPLSVVVVAPAPDSALVTTPRAVEAVQKAMMERYLAASMGSVIVNTVRRSDLTLENARDGRLVVVCPDTDEKAAKSVAAHVRKSLEDKLRVRVSVGIASFPGEALTLEDLVQTAESRIGEADSRSARDLAGRKAAIPALGETAGGGSS